MQLMSWSHAAHDAAGCVRGNLAETKGNFSFNARRDGGRVVITDLAGEYHAPLTFEHESSHGWTPPKHFDKVGGEGLEFAFDCPPDVTRVRCVDGTRATHAEMIG